MRFGSYIIGSRIECVVSRMNDESPGIYAAGQQVHTLATENKTYTSNVKSKSLTTNGLQNVVNDRLLQE